MALQLPAAVAAYIHASNAHDPDGVAACFSGDAVVRDENALHHGRAAIRAWTHAADLKYAAAMAPLACTPTAAGCLVRAEVAGNFPGSPVQLDFAFTLEGAHITALEVTP